MVASEVRGSSARSASSSAAQPCTSPITKRGVPGFGGLPNQVLDAETDAAYPPFLSQVAPAGPVFLRAVAVRTAALRGDVSFDESRYTMRLVTRGAS